MRNFHQKKVMLDKVLVGQRDDEGTPFKCMHPSCEMTYKTAGGLIKHHNDNHKANECLESSEEIIVLSGPLGIHQEMKKLVCTACKTCVTPMHAQRHMREKHMIKLDRHHLEKITNLGEEFFSQDKPDANTLWKELEVVHGYECSICNHLSTSLRYMKVHANQHTESQPRNSIIPANMSSLFEGKKRKYFKINEGDQTSQPDDTNIHDFSEALEILFVTGMRDMRSAVNDAEAGHGRFQNTTSFLLQWEQKIPRNIREKFFGLAIIGGVATRTLREQRIVEQVNEFGLSIHKNIQNASLILRSAIMRDKAETRNKGCRRFQFSCLQEESTRQKYSLYAAKLVLFFVRLIDDESNNASTCPFRPSADVVQEIRNFSQAIDGGPNNPESLQDSLQSFFRSLFFQRFNLNVDESQIPLFQFLFLSATKKDMRFEEVSSISQKIAKLQYLIRGVVLQDLVLINDESQQEQLLIYVRELQNTPYNMLCQVMGALTHINSDSPSKINVFWVDHENFTSLSADGVQVSVDMLRSGVTGMFAAAEELLKSLLFGNDQDPGSSEVVDSIQCGDLGYWFGKSTEEKDLKAVLQQVGGANGPRNQLMHSCRTQTIEWKAARVESFLETCHSFEELTLTLLHLTGGAPSRASEYQTLMLRNTVANDRSVFMMAEDLVVIQGYFKTRNVAQQERVVAKFLPKRLTDLLVKYYRFVRPLAMIFVKGHRGTSIEKWCNNMFVDVFGNPFSSAEVGAIFYKLSLKYMGVALRVKSYRHAAQAFLEKIIDPRIPNTPGTTLPFNEQMGHSVAVGISSYARSQMNLRSMSRENLHKFKCCSSEWHRFLNVSQSANRVTASSVRRRPTHVTVAERGAVTVPAIADVSLTPLPHLTALNPLSILPPHDFIMVPINRDPAPSINDNNIIRARRGLQDLLGMTRVLIDFRSAHQGNAIAAALENIENLLVVLPTGGGKSFVFMVPAALEGGNKATVVIVPIAILLLDLQRRCSEYGLSSRIWTPQNPALLANVILVQVEHTARPSFRQFVFELFSKNILRRIVFDECHFYLSWRNFRPVMDGASKHLRFPVPVILMSASVPPSMVQDLIHQFHISVKTIRTSTDRPELKYHVSMTASEQAMDNLISAELRLFGIGTFVCPDRAIVFTQTVAEAEALSRKINSEFGNSSCLTYTGETINEERKARFESWRSGVVRIMVATASFSAGVDYSHVRLVIHRGCARSMIAFAQESGRAGRDGVEAMCLTVTCPEFLQRRPQADIDASSQAEYDRIQKFVTNKDYCRRRLLQKFMDGSGSSCLASSYQKCDLCFSKTIQDNSDLAQREQSHDILMSTVASAQSRVASEISAANMISTIQRLKGYCSVCYVSAKGRVRHSLFNCPLYRGRCFECGECKCKARQCKFKPAKLRENCKKCFLPTALENVTFHVNGLSTNCDSGAADFVWPVAMMCYRDDSYRRKLLHKFDPGQHLKLHQDSFFRQWLIQHDCGLLNAPHWVPCNSWVGDRL
ncbi:MAG: helicase-related protein [bacterium]